MKTIKKAFKMNRHPNNDPSALINSFFAGNRINYSINIESFYLTLLDLINRKFVSVKIVCKKDKMDEKTLDTIILKINRHSTDKLHLFEKNVLKCISTLEYRKSINLLDTTDTLYKRLKVKIFQTNYDN
jgi:uncharacterized membrane protein